MLLTISLFVFTTFADAPEWKEFSSEEGRFKVLMPGEPKAYQLDTESDFGKGKLNMFRVMAGETGYVANYSDFPEAIKKQPLKQVFDSSRDGAIANLSGKLATEKDIKLGDHPGRETLIDVSGKAMFRAKVYLVGRRMYQVVMVGSKEAVSSKDAEKFFDSFKLTGDDKTTKKSASRVERSKPLPKPDKGLGTRFFQPSEMEKEFTRDWKKEELQSGSQKTESLRGKPGRRIAWFGIVREVKEDKPGDVTRLLVEMKYFDGLTDLHQQIVSINGAGDFRVVVPGIGHKIKRLELVRACGAVASEKDKIPEVKAEYVRCWDWGQFAFMPYGQDKSNPEWVKLRKRETIAVYESRPEEQYYEELLGKR
jgi:hypothetical protein